MGRAGEQEAVVRLLGGGWMLKSVKGLQRVPYDSPSSHMLHAKLGMESEESGRGESVSVKKGGEVGFY